METNPPLNEEVLLRLNVLINLLLDQSTSESALSTADKIDRLNQLGLPPKDIAKILGKPLNHITSVLAKRKKRTNKAND